LRRMFWIALRVVSLVTAYSIIFIEIMRYEGQVENANLITAFYWVIITITTVGYGEIVFYSPMGQIFSALASLSGVAILFALIVPLVMTPRFERLARELPTSKPPNISDHIIICGYNPIVETLTERLYKLKIPFLIVERSEDVAKGIYRKYPTLWGPSSDIDVLIKANIHSAKLLIANESDESNADVVLTVRRISDIVVIALVDDLSKSRFLDYAGATRIISPKTLLGTFIAQITSPPKQGIFPGAVQISAGVDLVVLPIYPDSPLIGKTIGDENFRAKTGANVAGIWQKGVFIPCPPPSEEIQSNSVLMAVGMIDQLSKLRDLTKGTPKKGIAIVAGYGDVGRRIVRVLLEKGGRPVVVDRRDLGQVKCRHVMGDATSENVLIEAGIKDAVVIMIMLNYDADVVFTTLVARNINPNVFIVARANHVGSVENIYRAGADYVASVPIVASHMLTKIVQAQEEELAMIYETLELKRLIVKKNSALVGKSLRELNLPERFGCTIVAIGRAGDITTDIDPKTEIIEGDYLTILGSLDNLEAFCCAYERRLAKRTLCKYSTRWNT